MTSHDPSSRQVFVRAQMRAGGPKTDIHIRGVGPKLLLVEAEVAPALGTYVEILRPGLTIVGRVTHAAGSRFEVATREPVALAALNNPCGGPAGSGQGAATQRAPVRRARAPASRDRHDRSRSLGSRLEFALFGACGLIAAGTMGGAIFQTLSQPFAAISDNLASPNPAGRAN